MNPELAENETYKYASRLNHPMPGNIKMGIKRGGTQLERIIDMLRKTPLNNQSVAAIASPEDLDICYGNDGKLDPPCLREIDFKVLPDGEDKYLSVSVYFRSWDLWGGFPSNLGGIELLKQYVAQETEISNGPMYAYSSGLHIYNHHEDVARLRVNRSEKDK